MNDFLIQQFPKLKKAIKENSVRLEVELESKIYSTKTKLIG